ncbi:hypothetical protein ANAPC1_00963 [Anaplasma phagocytophilum]|uniref:HGE-14 protein n=2 Tax=Anaplasma phagocytophilum TaxID=948 RepID=A0AA45UTB6_ANAPH|nr:hypothetical protein ANAPC1_00963 [Anaplasma phagocytophilum]
MYRDLGASIAARRFGPERYIDSLVHAVGSLFLMYRGYASTSNTNHVVAGRIEHCLQILLTLYHIRRGRASEYRARKGYADMCSVYEDVEQRIIPDLLLNPQVEVELRNAALQHLTAMMDIWMEFNEIYFDIVDPTDDSPDQPSTSGSGSVSSGLGYQQASYTPLQDHAYAQPSTSCDQPSTSGLGGTAGMGGSQASYMPPHDPGSTPYSYAQPSTSWDQPSTSGLGGTAGMGIQQASYVPPHDSGGMPYPYAQPLTSWDQPSTSGLGSAGAGLGSQQASHIPPHDSGGMPYSYAQPSTSWDQPSTSGLGGAAGMGIQQASHIPPHDPGMMPYSYAQPSTSGMGGAGAGLGSQQASHIPPHDPGMMPSAYAQPSTSYARPSTSWDQPSTSGMGGTGSRVIGPQASSVPLRVLERIPIPYGAPWDQPSTSGMGGAGLGHQQAPYIPPHDPGSTPYSYAQPSTSYARP